MNSLKWRLAIHSLLGVSFLALPYIFAPHGISQILSIVDNPHERSNFVAYVFMLAFFYANYYWFIPKLYFTKKYLLYAFSTVLCFSIILLLLLSVDRRDVFQPSSIPPPPPALPQDFRGSPPGLRPDKPGMHSSFVPNGQDKPPIGFELSHALFLFLVGVFVSLSLRINDRLRQTEREKLNTELSFLKAQINPHFLFNTLNSIYSLAIEQSPHTADAVVKLSSLMRYVMREADVEMVLLLKEFNYIENYIALQKLRLDDTAQIDFRVEGQPSGQQIPPLILISFIENAFKYGVNPQEKSVIHILLSITGNRLHLRTFNKKVRVFQDNDETSSGIGISNTQTRLQLHYPEKHLLILNETADDFTVELTIYL